jgi:hypothetical protein
MEPVDMLILVIPLFALISILSRTGVPHCKYKLELQTIMAELGQIALFGITGSRARKRDNGTCSK